MKAPDWLDSLGQEYWSRLVDHIDFSETSKTQLALLCDQLSAYRHACEILHRDGPIAETVGGDPKQHPAFSIRDKTLVQIRHLLKDLGLVDSKKETQVDELEELLG